MRLWIVLDLHGQASVRGVYDDPAVAHDVASVDPTYYLVQLCELNARPSSTEPAPIASRGASSMSRDERPRAVEPPAPVGPVRGFGALEPMLRAAPWTQLTRTMLATDFAARSIDDERVLVRRLDADPYEDDDIVTRLAETVAIAAQVRHPAWAPPRALGVLGPDAALVWAWPTGATLEQWRRACREPVSLDFAVRLLTPVLGAAQAMHDAHAAPLTICLHPSNVLVGADGHDRVLGAPLSPSLGPGVVERIGVLPIEGAVEWWGPELRDVVPHGPRSTVHTAGVTLAWLLLDELPRLTPFTGRTERDALVATLAAVRPDLPAALLPILRRALDADHTARFATPSEFARALGAFSTSPITAERQRRSVLARCAFDDASADAALGSE